MSYAPPDDESLPAGATQPTATKSAPERDDDFAHLPVIDRRLYALGGQIAKGGMGRILSARDRRAGRSVALKELLETTAAAKARFEREAKITARLAHPAIVPIYEIGQWDNGEPFYAMKHVEGESLDKVIARTASLKDRLALIPNVLAVADALAYAHSKAIIHRDLKPANVLVGAFGETVVIDWGLAKDLSNREPALADDPDALPTSHDGLTVAGRAMGTPAYMPPEQAEGDTVDERADVYALGATLYHVLAGAMPYGAFHRPADVLEELQHRPPTPLRELAPDVPSDLLAIVDKAMARERVARYPTAVAFADDLRRFQTGQLVGARRYSLRQLLWRWVRRHRIALSFAALAVLAGIAVYKVSRPAFLPDTRCQGLNQSLAGVWDPARSEAVKHAFLATQRAHAAATYDRVASQLDGYSRSWVTARIASCEATHKRGEQSEALMDLRMTCLERRLGDLRALVTLFASKPDGEVLDHSVKAAYGLPDIASCADANSLQAVPPPPADGAARKAVDDVADQLAQIKALGNSGKYGETLTLAKAAADAAGQTGYVPIIAEALFLLGDAKDKTGAAAEAEETLYQAATEAERAHDDVLAARSWTGLLFVVGYHLAKTDTKALRGAAAASVARLPEGSGLRTRLDSVNGTTLLIQGKFDEAIKLYERSLQRAIAEHGEDHPDVGGLLNNLGRAFIGAGKPHEALPYIERAVAVREKVLGSTHPDVAVSLGNLGLIMRAEGKFDEARQAHERAIAIQTATLGDGHPDLAFSLANLGAIQGIQGRPEEAAVTMQRALEVFEKARGPDHPDVAAAHNNLAEILRHQHKYVEARAHDEQALAIYERSLGLEHPYVVFPLMGLAECAIHLGEPQQAVALAERAVRLRKTTGAGDPVEFAQIQFALVRALWEAGVSTKKAALRKRADDLAVEIRKTLREQGPRAAMVLNDVEMWFTARRRP